MNLRRIFANAIARRVAYVLVALVLAWVGLGDARAEYGYCMNPSATAAACQYKSEAYAGLNVHLQHTASAHQAIGRPTRICLGAGAARSINGTVMYGDPGGTAPPCPAPENVGWGRYRSWAAECPDGEAWDPVTHTCGGCSEKPHLGPGAWSNVQGDKMCRDSCEYEGGVSPGGGVGVCFDVVIDGERYRHCTGWVPTGAQCTVDGPGGYPGTPSEAPPDSDGDGTSDDFDSAPNNPGRGGSGPDGEPTQEDSDCGGVGQPECGALGSGSGNGNTSGGGGDCNTPPSSTGDPILAQIAFQTWATRCAIVATANQGSGTGTGEGEGDQPNWTKGEGPEAPVDDTDYVTQQTRFGLPVSTDLLDQENIFGSASCEHFSIPIWRGVTVSTSDFDGWCTLQAILRGLILIFGAFTAIQILLGKW